MKETIIGFILGFVLTLIYDYFKYLRLNLHKKASLKLYLKAEKEGNLAILNDLSGCFKINGLELSTKALTECLKNPELFSKESISSFLELYKSIIFYNTRMPEGAVQKLHSDGRFSSWSEKFQSLKNQLK